MNDSEDVCLMMEFRQVNEDLWIKFLKERRLYSQWKEYQKNGSD